MKKLFTRGRVFLLLAFCCGAAALGFGIEIAASSARTILPQFSSVGPDPIFSARRAAGTSGDKVAPEVTAATANGKAASVLILMTDQPDLTPAYSMTDPDARGWYVYNTLSSHAAESQAGIKKYLDTKGIPYQSFWVANMLEAEVDGQTLQEIAARDDVQKIDLNAPFRGIEDPSIARAGVTERIRSRHSPETIEWGVANVNAPQLWAQGITGQGIVIANQDTGMRWTHTAIKLKYRGWNGTSADHNYNWHDSIHSGGGPCGANAAAPCDDNGHGTHTTGTLVGDDGAGNQVGVAPGAKWIGCRNMDQGAGTPATYAECFQFFTAPTDSTGSNPNPTLRPHVMNNSWGCPTSEGCTTRGELETVVNNAEAAGIFVEVSAGNNGSSCSSVSDVPAVYSASFSTGAIDINNSLAGFSSRGPSTFYTPNVLKPNISAPGVNVRSCTFTSDTTYGVLSGTSMAGPHVVGVVALLWSARPDLVRNIAATKMLLQNTANPAVSTAAQTCGGISSSQIPNNSFGYGRVDALAAFNALTSQTAEVSGRVLTPDGRGLRNAVVTITSQSDKSQSVLTSSLGYYSFDEVTTGGQYTISVTSKRYRFSPVTVQVTSDLTNQNFTGQE